MAVFSVYKGCCLSLIYQKPILHIHFSHFFPPGRSCWKGSAALGRFNKRSKHYVAVKPPIGGCVSTRNVSVVNPFGGLRVRGSIPNFPVTNRNIGAGPRSSAVCVCCRKCFYEHLQVHSYSGYANPHPYGTPQVGTCRPGGRKGLGAGKAVALTAAVALLWEDRRLRRV